MRETARRLESLERVGRALSDPTRTRVLLALVRKSAYPSELAAAIGTTRQNVSNHLTCLRGCGLVRAVPEGRHIRYELADPALGTLLLELSDVAVAAHCDECDGRSRRAG